MTPGDIPPKTIRPSGIGSSWVRVSASFQIFSRADNLRGGISLGAYLMASDSLPITPPKIQLRGQDLAAKSVIIHLSLDDL